MSELILLEVEVPVEDKVMSEWKSLLSFDINEKGETRVQINNSNEAHLALALRRMGQVVDQYLAECEMKRIQEATRIVKATVPQSILDKIRG